LLNTGVEKMAGHRLRVSTARSADADQHASLAAGWDLTVCQWSPGRFDGSLVAIQLDRMQILRDRTNRALSKQGTAWPGSLVFSLPMGANGEGRLAGRTLSFPACLLANAGNLPELRTPEQLDLVCVAVDRAWLSDMAEASGCALAARRIKTTPSRLHCLPSTNQRLLQSFEDIFGTLPELAQTLEHRGSRAALEGAVADLLLEALSTGDDDDLRAAPPHKRVVDKARAYVMENMERQPTIEDICRHVGVSRRKLQNCFHQTLGCSPIQFLRLMRLNGVRHSLLDSRKTGPASVGDVAAHWGFWHLSRFAGDYRDLFGELPSETLRRARM
jgi:AraC family transcriptional regulator, ethanolamine operon transcriptional activator